MMQTKADTHARAHAHAGAHLLGGIACDPTRREPASTHSNIPAEHARRTNTHSGPLALTLRENTHAHTHTHTHTTTNTQSHTHTHDTRTHTHTQHTDQGTRHSSHTTHAHTHTHSTLTKAHDTAATGVHRAHAPASTQTQQKHMDPSTHDKHSRGVHTALTVTRNTTFSAALRVRVHPARTAHRLNHRHPPQSHRPLLLLSRPTATLNKRPHHKIQRCGHTRTDTHTHARTHARRHARTQTHAPRTLVRSAPLNGAATYLYEL